MRKSTGPVGSTWSPQLLDEKLRRRPEQVADVRHAGEDRDGYS
jgi:hypothetical protein